MADALEPLRAKGDRPVDQLLRGSDEAPVAVAYTLTSCSQR